MMDTSSEESEEEADFKPAMREQAMEAVDEEMPGIIYFDVFFISMECILFYIDPC